MGHDAPDSVRQEVCDPVSLVGACQRPKRGSGPKAPKTPRSKRFGTLVEKLSGGQSTYRPLFSCKNVSHDFGHFLLKKRSIFWPIFWSKIGILGRFLAILTLFPEKCSKSAPKVAVLARFWGPSSRREKPRPGPVSGNPQIGPFRRPDLGVSSPETAKSGVYPLFSCVFLGKSAKLADFGPKT